ncbi:MAG TPA: VOC family protein [Gaiellaceae bacterium]|nr:VOC family protein [Gaiellaceae bacterium]
MAALIARIDEELGAEQLAAAAAAVRETLASVAGVSATVEVDADRSAPHLGHLLLQTSDLDAAEEFYLGFLGLTLRDRSPFRDGRTLTVTNEGLGLTSGRPADGANVVEHVAFAAAGIEALAARARAAGIEILDGPTRTARYGLSVYLADPDGNRIEVFGDREQP